MLGAVQLPMLLPQQPLHLLLGAAAEPEAVQKVVMLGVWLCETGPPRLRPRGVGLTDRGMGLSPKRMPTDAHRPRTSKDRLFGGCAREYVVVAGEWCCCCTCGSDDSEYASGAAGTDGLEARATACMRCPALLLRAASLPEDRRPWPMAPSPTEANNCLGVNVRLRVGLPGLAESSAVCARLGLTERPRGGADASRGGGESAKIDAGGEPAGSGRITIRISPCWWLTMFGRVSASPVLASPVGAVMDVGVANIDKRCKRWCGCCCSCCCGCGCSPANGSRPTRPCWTCAKCASDITGADGGW